MKIFRNFCNGTNAEGETKLPTEILIKFIQALRRERKWEEENKKENEKEKKFLKGKRKGEIYTFPTPFAFFFNLANTHPLPATERKRHCNLIEYIIRLIE